MIATATIIVMFVWQVRLDKDKGMLRLLQKAGAAVKHATGAVRKKETSHAVSKIGEP